MSSAGPLWPQLCVFRPRAHGDTQHCRKALHRAVQCTSDYPEHVCEVLLTMERTEGADLARPRAWGLSLDQCGRRAVGVRTRVFPAPPL